ncbi:MAG TPA: tail fiber domain-containing protein [Casimicrobiaceae bacterium]|nr:tail fiber domain-containing protein [Casimicrobiaceae bacterium]
MCLIRGIASARPLRKSIIRLAVVIAFFASPAYAQICAPFTDVAASNPFCSNIQWMLNRGVTQGCGPNVYCPADVMPREQMAAFLNRLAEKVVFQNGGNAFGVPAVLGTTESQPVEIHAGGRRAMRYVYTGLAPNLIGGDFTNSVETGKPGQTIAGGGLGDPYRCFDPQTGTTTRSCGNHTDEAYATVGGGLSNLASGNGSTVAGGKGNTAGGLTSTVSGGAGNTALGVEAMVPGGVDNHADGAYSFAAGRRGHALEHGMFVWADSRDLDFTPTSYRAAGQSVNTFNVRATGIGGAWIVTGITAAGVPTWGCYAQNGTGWTCTSDREVKRNLEPLDGLAVLQKIAAMPVYRWQPKDGPNADVVHAGPTAQDFKAAFGLGDSDKAIGLQDVDGVALAAIKGLYQLVVQQAGAIEALREALSAQPRGKSEKKRRVIR